ncbi:SDR family NAD(P)-dependent oxidoreductase [Bradyrhizobium genosp. P]|uniref:SDR family NAD(P)-dependent oxidoreductase n=1 Tax=Bradyrhizobium genosp. P TaxID=83641 RepID=UPI003CF363F6
MLPEQKLVLVTGAGSGIGRALCLEAAQRGMMIALCGRRLDALQTTAALLGPSTSHLIIPADITRPEDRRRIVDHIGSKRGKLDILINNAGIVEGGSLETFDDDAIARTFQTNVMAPMALTRDLMPLLVTARPSRVVNVGSIFGDIGYPEFTCYSAAKFALRGFSIALRREWKQKGIGVTYAAPRATQTDAAVAFAGLIAKTKMSLDSPEQVARQIWRAVADGQDTVYAPAPERIYVLIQRLFPRVIDWSLSRTP